LKIVAKKIDTLKSFQFFRFSENKTYLTIRSSIQINKKNYYNNFKALFFKLESP
jgi:hypothetical protein